MSEIKITVEGPVGSGKSALLGEIEILCKAIGIPVRHADPEGAASEKAMTHADWAEYLEMYEPSVVLQEKDQGAIEADRQANKITGETSDGYHTFNELYAHRVRLFCLLMHAHKNNAWWSRKHHDGSAWEGWVIAGIDTPEGTATYHLPESEIENLPEGIELPNGKEWDGHTAADVLVRLLSLRQARSEPVAWRDMKPEYEAARAMLEAAPEPKEPR